MDRYRIIEYLGGGTSAAVLQATDKLTKETVALKKIKLNANMEIPRNIIREAALLHDLQHENIIRLESVFVHEGCLCLVLEYLATDVKLHMRQKKEKYPGITKNFLKQLLSGISYCHSYGVLHRDLKNENLLIDTRTDTLKIADFGLARGFLAPDLTLTPEVVTLGYRAPEILLRSDHYSTPVDMWSVGCIFAEMVNRKPLFQGQTQIDVLREIFSMMGTPDEETWPGVTSLPDFPHGITKWQPVELATCVPELEPAGVDLLSKLLCLDPKRRITAEDALGHEYLA